MTNDVLTSFYTQYFETSVYKISQLQDNSILNLSELEDFELEAGLDTLKSFIFSDDGLTLYLFDDVSGEVVTHNLETPHDYHTISKSEVYDFSSYSPLYLTVSLDKIVILDNSSQVHLFEFDQSSNSWGLLSSFDLTTTTSEPLHIALKSTGDILLVGDYESSFYRLKSYSLPSIFDLSSAVFSITVIVSPQKPKDIAINSQGTGFYALDDQFDVVNDYSFFNGEWDISLGFDLNAGFSLPSLLKNPASLAVSNAGFSFFVSSSSYNYLEKFTSSDSLRYTNLNTSAQNKLFDYSIRKIASSVLLPSNSFYSLNETGFTLNKYESFQYKSSVNLVEVLTGISLKKVISVFFSENRLLILVEEENGNYRIAQVELSAVNDYTSGTLFTSYNLNNSTNPLDLALSSSGEKLFLLKQGTPNTIGSYSLSSPNDISTLTFDLFDYNPVNQGNAKHLSLLPDDSKLLLSNNSEIREYSFLRELELSSVIDINISFSPSFILDSYSDNGNSAILFSQRSATSFSLSNAWAFDKLLEKATPKNYNKWKSELNGFYIASLIWQSTDLNKVVHISARGGGKITVVDIDPDDLLENGVNSTTTYDIESFNGLTTGNNYNFLNGLIGNKEKITGDIGEGTKTYLEGTIWGILYENQGNLTVGTCPTPYDFNNLTLVAQISLANLISGPSPTREFDSNSLEINGEGTLLYLANNSDDNLYEFQLSNAWDITSASLSRSGRTTFSSLFDEGIDDFGFFDDGKKCFTGGGKSGFYKLKIPYLLEDSNISQLTENEDRNDDTSGRFLHNRSGTQIFFSPRGNSSYDFVKVPVAKRFFIEDISPSSPPSNFDPNELFLSSNKNRLYAKSKNGSISVYDIANKIWTHTPSPPSPINELTEGSDFDTEKEIGYYFDSSATPDRLFEHKAIDFIDLATDGNYLDLNPAYQFLNTSLYAIGYTPFGRGVGTFPTETILKADKPSGLFFYSQTQEALSGISGITPTFDVDIASEVEDLDLGGGYFVPASPLTGSIYIDGGSPIFEALVNLDLTSNTIYKSIYLDLEGNLRESELKSPLDIGIFDTSAIAQTNEFEYVTLLEFLENNGSPSSSYVSYLSDQMGNSDYFQDVLEFQPQFSNYNSVTSTHELFETSVGIYGLKFDGNDDFLYVVNRDGAFDLDGSDTNLVFFASLQLESPVDSFAQPIFSLLDSLIGYSFNIEGGIFNKNIQFTATSSGGSTINENLLSSLDMSNDQIDCFLLQFTASGGTTEYVANSSLSSLNTTPNSLALDSSYSSPDTIGVIGSNGVNFFEGIIYEFFIGVNPLNSDDSLSILQLNHQFINQTITP